MYTSWTQYVAQSWSLSFCAGLAADTHCTLNCTQAYDHTSTSVAEKKCIGKFLGARNLHEIARNPHGIARNCTELHGRHGIARNSRNRHGIRGMRSMCRMHVDLRIAELTYFTNCYRAGHPLPSREFTHALHSWCIHACKRACCLHGG